MKKFGFLSLVLGVMFMAGCSTGSAPRHADANWFSQKWELTQIYKDNVEIPLVKEGDESVAYVQFVVAENRFNGNAGCNQFFGSYKLSDKDQITFGGAGMTRKMCAPENMAIEDAFVQLFSDKNATSIETTEKTLTLKNDNVKAVFAAK